MAKHTIKTQSEIDVLFKDYQERTSRHALIDEAICIGCTKCIQACPFDAILGAAKLMHTVIVQECIGCELCIPPCPVDCIAMVNIDSDTRPSSTNKITIAQKRYTDRLERINVEKIEKQRKHEQAKRMALRKATIQAAVARVKAKQKGNNK